MKEDAKACQAFGQQGNATDTKNDDSPNGPNKKDDKTNGGDGIEGSGKGIGGDKDKKPVCLYPPHHEKRIKHLLKDSEACPQEEKEKYIRVYLEERKRPGGKAQRLRKNSTPATATSNSASSILFTAVFGSKFRDQICAGNGADANIIDNETLRRITAAGVDLEVKSLSESRVFDMATVNVDGKNAKLVCKGFSSFDTELHIRQGSTPCIRNLKWLVTEQRVAKPSLGRPILEALGLNTRDLLAVAADQFCGSVDAERLIGSISDAEDGLVSRVMEGVFHADGGEDVKDYQESSSKWCDTGGETTEKWEQALHAKLAEAEENGFLPLVKTSWKA